MHICSIGIMLHTSAGAFVFNTEFDKIISFSMSLLSHTTFGLLISGFGLSNLG